MRYLIALLLAVGALAIAWVGNFTNIDMMLAHQIYDPSGSFPMRNAWIAETFGHIYMKYLLTLLALGVIAASAYDWWRPRAGWTREFRLRLRVLALSAILVPLVISLLKKISYSHCPWDLAEFGGAEKYVRLFEAALPGVSAGHCMPAGHASSALWLIALCVFWLPKRPRMAALVFGVTLAVGLVLAWLQQLRGAHFLTHTLWSVWIACAIVSTVYALVMRADKLGARKSALGIEPGAQVGERPL
jgi:membrane-associated PAP2 superfamily phosphatase